MSSHTYFMRSHHIMYDITCIVFMIWLPPYLNTSFTVSLSLRPVYQLHHTHSLYYITLYVWHHIQYACHHMNTLWYHSCIGMISHPVYVWHPIQYVWYHPYCFHENAMTMPDISPTIFDITAPASVWSHPLYWSHHNNYGSHHTWHTYDIIHTVYHISFTRYDINPHYLWHLKHCTHDIRSPIYDITSMVYDISSPIPVTSQPLYL